MSMASQITALAVAIAQRFNTVAGTIGALTGLKTSAKGSIVAALNELAAGQASAGAQIKDDAASTTTVYSSTKVQALVNKAISDLVNGAPAALDTLGEIASQFAANGDALNSLMQSVGVRVRFDQAQALDATQQAQARFNIGAIAAADVGDTAHDFVADFNQALTA